MKNLILKRLFTTTSLSNDFVSRVNDFNKTKKVNSEYIIYYNDLPLDKIDIDSYVTTIETFVENISSTVDVVMLKPQEVITSIEKRTQILDLPELTKVLNQLADIKNILDKANVNSVRAMTKNIDSMSLKLKLYEGKNIDITRIINYCIGQAIANLKERNFNKEVVALEPDNNLYLTRRINTKTTFSDKALFLMASKTDYVTIYDKLAKELEMKAKEKTSENKPKKSKIAKTPSPITTNSTSDSFSNNN